METTIAEQHQDIAAAPVETRSLFIPQQAEPVRVLEQYHRYLYASRFTKGKRVLDIASGEGYGAAFLSLNAESVIGIDGDEGVVQHASQKYGEFSNLRFETGRCESFRAREQGFDVVVSFETLQSLSADLSTQFMENIVHALTPNGVFIVSTPIRSADAQTGTAEKSIPGYSGVELFEFLKRHFQFVRFIGQKPLTMSTMWSLHEWKDDLFRFHVREDLFTLPREIEMFAEPTHVIALCSDEKLSQDIANSSKSLYFDTLHADRAREILAEYEDARILVQHSQTRTAQVEEELEMHRQAVTVLTSENLKHINHIDGLQKQLDERVSRLMELEQENAERIATLDKLQREFGEQTMWADKLATDHEILSARVQDLQAQLDDRSAELDSGREENRKISDEIARLRDILADLQSTGNESAAQLISATAENDHLHTRISDLQHQYQELVTSMKASSTEVEHLRGQVRSLQSYAEEKSRAATEALEQVRRQEKQIEELGLELQSRVPSDRVAEETAALRIQVEELSRSVAGHAEAATRSDGENRQLRAQLEQIQSHAGEFDQKLTEQTALASNVTQENQKLRARVHELQKQFDERSAHARTVTQENEKLHSRVASVQKSIEEKSAMIILLNQEIDSHKEKIQAAQREYDQKLQQAHQWEKENRKRLEHVNELQRKCDEQAFQVRQMKIDFEKQTAAFDTFQKSQGDLQQRYNRSQIKVQELTQDVAILEQKFAAVKSSGAYKLLASIGVAPKE